MRDQFVLIGFICVDFRRLVVHEIGNLHLPECRPAEVCGLHVFRSAAPIAVTAGSQLCYNSAAFKVRVEIRFSAPHV